MKESRQQEENESARKADGQSEPTEPAQSSESDVSSGSAGSSESGESTDAAGSSESGESNDASDSSAPTSSEGTVDRVTPDFVNVQVDLRNALVAGVLTTLVSLTGAWLVGLVSGADTSLLLENTLTNTRSFAGTIVLALSTVLALMLTILSLSTGTDAELESSHYQRIKQISWFDSITLVAAILIYLLFNFPLGESRNPDQTTIDGIYYATLVASSFLGGALCAIVLMLFNTVRDIIGVVAPDK